MLNYNGPSDPELEDKIRHYNHLIGALDRKFSSSISLHGRLKVLLTCIHSLLTIVSVFKDNYKPEATRLWIKDNNWSQNFHPELEHLKRWAYSEDFKNEVYTDGTRDDKNIYEVLKRVLSDCSKLIPKMTQPLPNPRPNPVPRPAPPLPPKTILNALKECCKVCLSYCTIS